MKLRLICQAALSVFLSASFLPTMAQESNSSPTKHALSGELVNKITAAVDNDTVRLQDIFKDIHQHPELGFMETRTAGIVAKELICL